MTHLEIDLKLFPSFLRARVWHVRRPLCRVEEATRDSVHEGLEEQMWEHFQRTVPFQARRIRFFASLYKVSEATRGRRDFFHHWMLLAMAGTSKLMRLRISKWL